MPIQGKPLKPIPPHGDIKRYRSRIEPCRCDDCTEAYNEYHRNYKAEQRYRQRKLLNEKARERYHARKAAAKAARKAGGGE